ncbi:dihydroxyacetone phosphate acyltransferase [Copidosoma floridanum]|uniref:dihydroxyacetone phosphate acyltransferase n=1 Tax=Copidosoma floridanum TaxID=29053 RepID=UPI0006C96D12|nr:dihydroxyacetone phosphate acyltransferase [Copidosoma floridanum]XP_014205299.1 dihydroxyacetone phosphate acyltransferase [Copidosoma floridanum]
MEARAEEFVDFLAERRKDSDIMWVSRFTKPLPAHKLAPELVYNRKRAIEAVLADYKIKALIQSQAAARNVPSSTVVSEAKSMLEEMASKSHLPTVRWIGLVVTKVLKRILISIRINDSILHSLKNQMSFSSVQYVYLPTHRSYLDFILLSYILFSYDMALPNIASGMDFYKMKFVGELLRHTGAFYLKRSFSSDPLYKEVFRTYVNSLVSNSDRAIEFFIEGTRSRSQKTLPPKFGLLSIILENLLKSTVYDLQLIPISISYDKPLEELLFVYELLGIPKPPESTSGLFSSLSKLLDSSTHGHVYVKIAPPISGRDFINMKMRRQSALSPNSRVPSHVTKQVAYAVIDRHKRNTVLTPFNLISLLFNERMYSYPKEPYLFDDLLQDYSWIKNFFVKKIKAIVNPPALNVEKNDMEVDADRNEVLESLETHKDLIEVDAQNNLKLKNNPANFSQVQGFKGHALSDKTLRIAVPVINLMIYVNPVFAYLSLPALAALCINLSPKETAIKRYMSLRSLFTSEFALPANMSEPELIKEWEEITGFLTDRSSEYSLVNNKELHSLLCNLLTPFIVSLHVACKTILEWKDPLQCQEKNIIKECQRFVEESLYQDVVPIKHPYSLTLDVYVSLLSSLVACEYVTLDEQGFYKPNRINMETLVLELDNILNSCSSVSYLDNHSLFIPKDMPNLLAKL